MAFPVVSMHHLSFIVRKVIYCSDLEAWNDNLFGLESELSQHTSEKQETVSVIKGIHEEVQAEYMKRQNEDLNETSYMSCSYKSCKCCK